MQQLEEKSSHVVLSDQCLSKRLQEPILIFLQIVDQDFAILNCHIKIHEVCKILALQLTQSTAVNNWKEVHIAIPIAHKAFC